MSDRRRGLIYMDDQMIEAVLCLILQTKAHVKLCLKLWPWDYKQIIQEKYKIRCEKFKKKYPEQLRRNEHTSFKRCSIIWCLSCRSKLYHIDAQLTRSTPFSYSLNHVVTPSVFVWLSLIYSGICDNSFLWESEGELWLPFKGDLRLMWSVSGYMMTVDSSNKQTP